MHWKEDVVKTLLTKTSLASAFYLPTMSVGPEPDELADMRKEHEGPDAHHCHRALSAYRHVHLKAAFQFISERFARICWRLRIDLSLALSANVGSMLSE